MASPIRVLDVRDSPWLDGPGRTILQCASMLDPARCVIHVAGFCTDARGDHDYLRAARALELPVVPIHEKRSLDPGVIRQLLAVIRAEGVDMVHTHDFRSNLFGLAAARLAGIPVLATCHGWIATSRKRQLMCRLDRYLLRRCVRVVAVSEFMAGQLKGFGIAPERIVVIRNALVIDDYRPAEHDTSFRDELGIPADAPLIGIIGRLSPEKGQDLFLQAARQLLAFQQNSRFVLIGIGPEEDRLLALRDELGLGDRIVFAGFRTDMAAVYRSLDLVVQSSYTEGMPNVILEALLMEVPVVATRVGGTAEIVEPVCPDLLIAPGDVQALVQAMKTVLENRAFYRSVAARGRHWVAGHFNQDQRVARLLAVYESVHAGQ